MRVHHHLRPLSCAALAALALVGCGDEQDSDLVDLDFAFALDQAGTVIPCRAGEGVDRVEVVLFRRDGQSVMPGFTPPMLADCQQGRFFATGIPADEYVLQVTARGTLDEDPNASLYALRQSVQLPPAEPLVLDLAAEVGFLDLAWTFGDSELAPCATEVGSIEVFMGRPGSGQGAYNGRFACTDTPVRIPRAFAPQEYIIQVNALSPPLPPANAVLRQFDVTERRFLVRGVNRYEAVLEPLGGRLNLDWRFAVGADEFTDCDAPVIGVGNVDIEVRGPGDDAVTDSAPCTATPYPFNRSRYLQGGLLTLALSAEGIHYFEGEQTFTMPDGDYDSGRVTLHAVGTATLAVTVRTATCANNGVTGYEVAVEGPVDFADDAADLGPANPSVALGGLRYGVYEIEVSQQTAQGIQCRARAQRIVNARENGWRPLEL